MIVAMMVIWLMTLLEPLMIDDFDGPLMETAHDDGSLYGPLMSPKVRVSRWLILYRSTKSDDQRCMLIGGFSCRYIVM